MNDAPDTVVLIHGLWMTPLGWQNWIEEGWQKVADYALDWATSHTGAAAVEH